MKLTPHRACFQRTSSFNLPQFASARKLFVFLLIAPLLFFNCFAQKQTGPYTVYELMDHVYRIEDSNDSNPAGIVWGEDGKPVSFNNCSDMYLVLGSEQALLIDLSNAIQWDSSAIVSLKKIVYELAGDREFAITITHNHGDHLGMLPAFSEDEKVTFWVSEAEFSGTDIFPPERTSYFKDGATWDLGGGMVLETLEVPGHTDHSTVFFLKGKNLVFSGDAIGSGDDVWLFNYNGFLNLKNGIDRLLDYITDPKNGIDEQKLVIYGGHYWQKGEREFLKANTIRDLKTLIEKIGDGSAQTKEMKTFLPFLDTSFKYQTAGIAWNREAAKTYQSTLIPE
jgi:glyoxylase-like metal-dependent hydrolase (beta-lactamase superfamily II)